MQSVHPTNVKDRQPRELIFAKTNTYRVLIALPETNDSASFDAATIALWHLKKCENIKAAANKVRAVLEDDGALNHFNAAQ
jgi:hypothetical protein